MVTLLASIPPADLAHPADPVKLAERRADVFHDDMMSARSVPRLASRPVVVAAPRPRTDRILRGHLQAHAPAAAARDLAFAAGWRA